MWPWALLLPWPWLIGHPKTACPACRPSRVLVSSTPSPAAVMSGVVRVGAPSSRPWRGAPVHQRQSDVHDSSILDVSEDMERLRFMARHRPRQTIHNSIPQEKQGLCKATLDGNEALGFAGVGNHSHPLLGTASENLALRKNQTASKALEILSRGSPGNSLFRASVF